jgi:hypothetical protein
VTILITDELEEIALGHRLTIEVTLHIFAMTATEKIGLLSRFNAFCNYPLVKLVRHCHYRSTDAVSALLASNLLHERLIYLQNIERQLLKVT